MGDPPGEDFAAQWQWDGPEEPEEEEEEMEVAVAADEVLPEHLWTEAIQLASDCAGNASETAGHVEGRNEGFCLEAQRVRALADRMERLHVLMRQTDLKAALSELEPAKERVSQAYSTVKGPESEDLLDLEEDLHMLEGLMMRIKAGECTEEPPEPTFSPYNPPKIEEPEEKKTSILAQIKAEISRKANAAVNKIPGHALMGKAWTNYIKPFFRRLLKRILATRFSRKSKGILPVDVPHAEVHYGDTDLPGARAYNEDVCQQMIEKLTKQLQQVRELKDGGDKSTQKSNIASSSSWRKEGKVWMGEEGSRSGEQEGWLLYMLGFVYEFTGEQKKALSHYHKAVDLWPGQPSLLLQLAVTLEREGEIDSASARYEECIQSCKESDEIASKQYAESISPGLDGKNAAHIATTCDISGGKYDGGSITGLRLRRTDGCWGTDGSYSITGDSRILVMCQDSARQNGLYSPMLDGDEIVALARTADATIEGTLLKGSFVHVYNGTHHGQGFVVQEPAEDAKGKEKEKLQKGQQPDRRFGQSDNIEIAPLCGTLKDNEWVLENAQAGLNALHSNQGIAPTIEHSLGMRVQCISRLLFVTSLHTQARPSGRWTTLWSCCTSSQRCRSCTPASRTTASVTGRGRRVHTWEMCWALASTKRRLVRRMGGGSSLHGAMQIYRGYRGCGHIMRMRGRRRKQCSGRSSTQMMRGCRRSRNGRRRSSARGSNKSRSGSTNDGDGECAYVYVLSPLPSLTLPFLHGGFRLLNSQAALAKTVAEVAHAQQNAETDCCAT
jgi:tetratricopeptide (TPR) repeat protein